MGFVYFVLWHRLTLLSTSERAKFSPLAPTDGCPLASAGSSDPFFREGSWLSGLALPKVVVACAPLSLPAMYSLKHD